MFTRFSKSSSRVFVTIVTSEFKMTNFRNMSKYRER